MTIRKTFVRLGMAVLLALVGFAVLAPAHVIGGDKNPIFLTKQCTSDGCVTVNNYLTLDLLSRQLTSVSGANNKNCGSWKMTHLDAVGNMGNVSRMQGGASVCKVQGANYDAAGVIVSSSNSFDLRLFGKNSTGGLVKRNPKVYILDESGDRYRTLTMGTEFTFDVDLRGVPCGAVSAVVAQEMDALGSKSAADPGGARLGAGFCNAQCPPNLILADAVVNISSSGSGVCCPEIDIFHSNSRGTQAAPHPCYPGGPTICSEEDGTCKDGANPTCDQHGCWMKPYMQGARDFYGRGKDFAVDTSRHFTVVTQFLANEDSSWGGMRRMYIQDGNLIENFPVDELGTPAMITPQYCAAVMSKKTPDVLGNFTRLGGLDSMAQSLSRGMVVSWALWVSGDTGANWLDTGDNGPCHKSEGNMKTIMTKSPDTTVTYSDIRMGEIGTTYLDKLGTAWGDGAGFWGKKGRKK